MFVVKFVNRVKYNNMWYAPHTPFQIQDKDLELLQSRGAIIVEPVRPLTPPDSAMGGAAVGDPVLDPVVEPEPEPESEPEPIVPPFTLQELTEMSVREMREAAAKSNIDIPNNYTLKADVFNFLKKAYGL